jgi:hypothetical protein
MIDSFISTRSLGDLAGSIDIGVEFNGAARGAVFAAGGAAIASRGGAPGTAFEPGSGLSHNAMMSLLPIVFSFER